MKTRGASKSTVPEMLLLFAILPAQLRAFGVKITFLIPYIPMLEKGIFAILIIVAAANFFSAKLKLKELVIVVLFVVLAIVSYMITSSPTLSYLLLIPFAAKNTDFQKIIKTDLWAKILVMLFVFACYAANLTKSSVVLRNGVIRESFGFAHPNTLGYLSMMIWLESILLLRRAKKPVMFQVLASVAPILLCFLADSRTAIAAIVVAVFCLTVEDVLSKKRAQSVVTKKRKILYLVPIVLIIASFLTTYAYNNRNTLAIKLDTALSSRISLQSYYNKEYTLTPLGRELTSEDLQERPLDNGYYRILYNNGIFGLVALLVIVWLSLSKTQDEQNRDVASIIVLLLVYGLSEWLVFRALITPFWTIAFAKEGNKNAPKKVLS